MTPLSIVLFLVGAALGSFLNVVTLRYSPERSVLDVEALSGRSHCPHCRRPLRWYELIPIVSYLLQGGRCRSCGARLSPQYPLVELAGGVILVAVPWFLNGFYGISSALFASGGAPLWYYGLALAWVLACLTWLVIFIIDLRHYLIPDELNLLLGVLGVLVVVLLALNHGTLPAFRDSFLRHYALLAAPAPLAVWVNHAAGAAAGGLLFGLLVLVGRGQAMGMGDVKLAFVSGLLLGWPDIVLAAVIAFIAGGAWGAVLVLFKERSFGDKIPFAPFLVFGLAATVFFGYPILKYYFSLFGF